MPTLAFAFLFAAATAFTAAFPGRARAEGDPNISGPFVYENLAAYFIHGKSASGPVPLTLQEALDKGSVRVKETGTVNELKIENIGDEDVFIQSGDIVKGGRQDRVLTASFILPHKSDEMPIAAFCVEHGRWSARGKEDAASFASAYNSMPSREAKLAMKAPMDLPAAESAGTAGRRQGYAFNEVSQRQQKVWDQVAKTQTKLSGNVSESVASPQSATSLELSLENEKLKGLREKYIQALKEKGEAAGDIVGYVFAVNGRINSADVYPSNGLFRKMWEKLLAASITEAIADKAESGTAEPPSIGAVSDFLASPEKSAPKRQEIGGIALQDVHDAPSALYVEAARKDGSWIHRNYLAK